MSNPFKSPDAPDYKGAAEATAAANAAQMDKQTWQNRINQYGPTGSKTYEVGSTINPVTGKPMETWSEYTKLSPEQQAMFDQNQAIQGMRLDVGETAAGRLMDEYGQPMDWSGLSSYGETPTAYKTVAMPNVASRYTEGGASIGDPNDYRQQGEDASYESQMRRITPQYQDAIASMETKLRNQGLNPDDRAWQNQMQAMSEAYNDASQSARLTAASEGRQESALNWGQQMGQNQNIFNQNLSKNAQNYGMDMSGNQNSFQQRLASNNQGFEQQLQQAQYANALRQQQMVEDMQKRGFGLNEINAMTSGQQVGIPQFGGYNQAGYTPGADYASAALNQGNFDQGNYQALWGGIGSLAGAGANGYSSYKSNT